MMRRIASVFSLSNLIRATVPVALAISGALVAPAFTALDTPLKAASSEGCEGGGFSIVLPGGTVLEGELDTTVPAASLGTSFLVKGKYVEFEVVSSTDITHVLASASGSTGSQFTVLYFDNPNFRAREGDTVPYKDTTVVVTARVNFANDFSPKFVGRDSPQVATRIAQGCRNNILKRDGTTAVVDHCGGVSLWRVASGGRMGAVFGEDATEVAPPATNCTSNCQAQNRVRGQSVKLGFPFPVPDSSRLKPRFPATP